MRPYDYALGAGVASMGPILFHLMEKMHPSHSGAKALKTNYRFVAFLGITAGFLRAYMESSSMLFPSGSGVLWVVGYTLGARGAWVLIVCVADMAQTGEARLRRGILFSRSTLTYIP